MKWKKFGKIFDPTNHGLDFDCKIFAQSPQAVVFDNFVRIYFSTRKSDQDGMFLSVIAFVDFDKSFTKIINYSQKEVIPLGDLGCFDEHGIFPINPIRIGDEIWAYTCGWNRRVSVSVETSTGLAISRDNGLSFQKIGPGPVFSSSLYEPMLVGDSFVQFFEGIFHMWYIYGKYWLPPSEHEPPGRVYKIAHASSKDGINWIREGGEQIISDQLNEHECQALPTIIKRGDLYHMYFCFREATDFRKNPARGYRLGYAYSNDLKNWIRKDEVKGIDFSPSGWDSEMMCYPHIFEMDNKVYLLYNGNEFGKYGFGVAELVE